MTITSKKRKQNQYTERPVTRSEAKKIEMNTAAAEDANAEREKANTPVLTAFDRFIASYDNTNEASIAVNDPSVKDVELAKTPSPTPTPRPFG
jgi:hypothetical protein